MNFTKPFSALIGHSVVVPKLTVADAVSALQETLNKLGQVVTSRQESASAKVKEIADLTTQMNEDREEAQKAQAIQAKLAALLS